MFSLIVPLAIGFFAIRSATRETVTAEENGYLETLLSLPLQRRVLVGGSALATMVICAGILAVTGLLIFVPGESPAPAISLGLTFAGAFGLWPLAVFFAGVASVVGGLVSRSAEVTGIADRILVGCTSWTSRGGWRTAWSRCGGSRPSATTARRCATGSTSATSWR
jgi:putative exporter of polyketide antibiotics